MDRVYKASVPYQVPDGCRPPPPPPSQTNCSLHCGALELLVLGYQVIQVALGLSELHLIYTFTCVPVQDDLAPEHGHEMLQDVLEQVPSGLVVAAEGGGHF